MKTIINPIISDKLYLMATEVNDLEIKFTVMNNIDPDKASVLEDLPVVTLERGNTFESTIDKYHDSLVCISQYISDMSKSKYKKSPKEDLGEDVIQDIYNNGYEQGFKSMLDLLNKNGLRDGLYKTFTSIHSIEDDITDIYSTRAKSIDTPEFKLAINEMTTLLEYIDSGIIEYEKSEPKDIKQENTVVTVMENPLDEKSVKVNDLCKKIRSYEGRTDINEKEIYVFGIFDNSMYKFKGLITNGKFVFFTVKCEDGTNKAPRLEDVILDDLYMLADSLMNYK